MSTPRPQSKQQGNFGSDIRFNWNSDAKNVHIYITREGIIVKVYEASIFKLPVDCIVNEANDNLSHGGGIARVIEKAAGYELTREVNAYIKENGLIPVGLACTTTAGNLPYDCVIHAVGPRWDDYRPHSLQKVQEVERDLHSAITNSFYEAEKRNLDSIAVPAITIFAVPEELCVYQYARAIVDYSRKSSAALRPLREIHFIDINPSIIWKIQSMFKKMIDDVIQPNYDINHFIMSYPSTSYSKWQHSEQKNKNFGNGKKNKKKDASPAFGNPTFTDYTIENEQLITVSEENGVSIVKCGLTTLRLHETGMFKIKANAIVSIESRFGAGSDTLASEIKNKIYDPSMKEKYLNEKQKLFSSGMPLNLGDTPVSYGYGTGYDYVVHAVLQYFDISSKTPGERKQLIMKTYDNILAVVDNRDTTSIVMPLIGTGEVDKEIRCAAGAFVDSFTVFCNNRNTNTDKQLDVHLVLRTSEARKIVHTCFKNRAKASINLLHELPERPPLTSYNDDSLSAELNDSNGKDNCVICMDDLTDPVTLNCGHVFCKECIEQQFQHKKSCPTCGVVCGTITGDQPKGTMDVTTSHVFDCAGYRGCGRIVIQYDFPPGKQQSNHPAPGKYYKGIQRIAYLPDNNEGRQICELLKVAFDRKLTFTIGNSRTTGQEGVITWNDIHHKTDYRSNTQFGYPDLAYFDRVKDDLAAKEVTEKDIQKKTILTKKASSGKTWDSSTAADEQSLPTSHVRQTTQKGIEDDSVSGAQRKKPEILDTYVAIENIPLDYTLDKLSSALFAALFAARISIAPPVLVYMDGSTKGIAICNSTEGAKQLVGFKGVPGIIFKPQPKVHKEPTCTINCDTNKKQFIIKQLNNIYVTVQEKSDNQLLIVAQTAYQIEFAKYIGSGAIASNKRHQSELENIETIIVLTEVWEIVKTIKNENFQVLKDNDNVKIDFKDNNVTIEWSGTVSDEADLRNSVDVLRACCRYLKRKEIEEILLDRYDEDETPKWCNEVEETLGMPCCLYIPKQKKVFAYCDTYDDILKVKHQFLTKEGKVKTTGRRRRNMEQPSLSTNNYQGRDSISTVRIPPGHTSITDSPDNIGTVFAARNRGGQTYKASSPDDEIADSDILGSSTTSNPVVGVASGSDMIGYIKVTTPDFQGSTGSDMIGSITTKPIGQGATGSDMLGSIVTLDASDNSDEEKEDINLHYFAIVIRCRKRRGGLSTSILNAKCQEEALKWRYIFSKGQLQGLKQKLGVVCKSVQIRVETNVADIECENIKSSIIDDSLRQIVTQETTDLRVKEFQIKNEQYENIAKELKSNSRDFANQTVSLFIAKDVCFLVSPAHMLVANRELFEQTCDRLNSQAAKMYKLKIIEL